MLEALMKNLHLFIPQFLFDETLSMLGLLWLCENCKHWIIPKNKCVGYSFRGELSLIGESTYIRCEILIVGMQKVRVRFPVRAVLKARLHNKSRHACVRHEHLRNACLGCLHINVLVHVSSISRHLPLTICKQRLRSNNGEWWYCCYFVYYNHCKCS